MFATASKHWDRSADGGIQITWANQTIHCVVCVYALAVFPTQDPLDAWAVTSMSVFRTKTARKMTYYQLNGGFWDQKMIHFHDLAWATKIQNSWRENGSKETRAGETYGRSWALILEDVNVALVHFFITKRMRALKRTRDPWLEKKKTIRTVKR